MNESYEDAPRLCKSFLDRTLDESQAGREDLARLAFAVAFTLKLTRNFPPTNEKKIAGYDLPEAERLYELAVQFYELPNHLASFSQV